MHVGIVGEMSNGIGLARALDQHDIGIIVVQGSPDSTSRTGTVMPDSVDADDHIRLGRACNRHRDHRMERESRYSRHTTASCTGSLITVDSIPVSNESKRSEPSPRCAAMAMPWTITEIASAVLIVPDGVLNLIRPSSL